MEITKRSIQLHRADCRASGQRQHVEPDGCERDSVCRRTGLQVARVPRRFGNWHTIYTRMNRCPRAACWKGVREAQREQLVRIKIEGSA